MVTPDIYNDPNNKTPLDPLADSLKVADRPYETVEINSVKAVKHDDSFDKNIRTTKYSFYNIGSQFYNISYNITSSFKIVR